MYRISHVILQGTIKDPTTYAITSGNKWLNEWKNLQLTHKDLSSNRPSFVIDWKNGRINRWNHSFELRSEWVLKDVLLTYIDKNGRTILQVRPDEFRFHYNIARDGVIKNWKVHKKDFTSILRWSKDNIQQT